MTIVACKNGGYVCFFNHRSDIISNGETIDDAIYNLNIMYRSVILYESK